MTLQIRYENVPAGATFSHALMRHADRVRYAIAQTGKQIAAEVEEDGRRDIAQAGAFGARWIFGFHAEVREPTSLATKIDTWSDVSYFNIFEYGGIIKGKPLLWIPLSFSDAVGIRASEYRAPLFRVDRKAGGAPLLLSSADREPKYFGKESVTMPQKFHIRDICRNAMRRVPDYYYNNLAYARM